MNYTHKRLEINECSNLRENGIVTKFVITSRIIGVTQMKIRICERTKKLAFLTNLATNMVSNTEE